MYKNRILLAMLKTAPSNHYVKDNKIESARIDNDLNSIWVQTLIELIDLQEQGYTLNVKSNRLTAFVEAKIV
jgi:hypothetical protein